MTTPSRDKQTRTTGRISALVAATVAFAAACTSAPQAQPPPPTSSRSTASALPSSRPPVPRPLDATAHRDKPCALFTDEQAKVLGYLQPGSPEVQPELARCSWRSETLGESDLNVDYYPATDLLGQLYRRETTTWPTNSMAPVTIAAQPALKTTLPTPELCKVALALTDNQAVEIRVADKNTDSCDRAIQIAETIVHNLGG
jgi:hypothetical protein